MKITPLDIQKKTFRTVWRGLDEAEVDAFLDLVAGELEEAVKEGINLKEELRRKTARLEEYKDREKVLQETLLTAQKITSDIKAQARKEADLLLAEAERQAEKVVQDAQRRLVELIQDINAMKGQRARFEVELRKMVEGHVALLETFKGQPEEPKISERIEDNVAFLAPRRAAEGDGGGED